MILTFKRIKSHKKQNMKMPKPTYIYNFENYLFMNKVYYLVDVL